MTHSSTPDPREQLLHAGQALLDAHYEIHKHWYKIDMDPLMEYPDEEKDARFKAAEQKFGLLGIIEFIGETARLKQIAGDRERDYIRLRTTIEAMDKPRESPLHWENG